MTSPPVVPKHSFGQHFLVDPNILRVIERLAVLGQEDVVLEVGPGLGVLTSFLADRVGAVHAVEIDRSLERALRDALGARANVQLLFADALTLDLGALDPQPTKLVSNLPYNVAAPIVITTLEAAPSIASWCVMVQREVGERFFAQPGDAAYGAVSVIVQLNAERTGWHTVSRHVFRPVPRVDSALVAFRRGTTPSDYPRVKTLVQAAFAHRRKTIPNSVELAGLCDRSRAAAALVDLGHPETARAEALAPRDFVQLAELLA